VTLFKVKQVVEKHIQPVFGLVFIFFACSWLRLPVLLGDILDWAKDGSIPYLSAPSHIPGFLKVALKDYPTRLAFFHPAV
jgi:hypothetical protein